MHALVKCHNCTTQLLVPVSVTVTGKGQMKDSVLWLVAAEKNDGCISTQQLVGRRPLDLDIPV